MLLSPTLGLTAEEVLAAIVELSPVGLGVLDRHGMFVHSSTYPDLVGRSAFEVFRLHTETVKHLRAALTGVPGQWTDFREGIAYDIAARPVRGIEGDVRAVLLIGTVVTDRVAAQERLAASETKLAHVVDSNMVPMLFWTDTGVIEHANDALLDLFGYTRADITAGLTVEDLSLPESAELDARAREEIRTRGICTPYEKRMRHRDGTPIPVLAGASRFDRERRAGVAFVLDLSAAKRRDQERDDLNAKLVQVQKLESLGLLAGGIAHDFNNLLTAILGGAATASLALPDDSPAQPDLDIVMTAARRASDLTRQMLAYSGKGPVQVKAVDLSATIRELAALLETTISKRVQLRLGLAPTLPAIEADAAQMQQVIMNLVINAAEAIGDVTGTVLVTTGEQEIDPAYARELFAAEQLVPGRYVFLEVHDTGVGMDEITRAKIFDPFFTTKFTGRGLGLASVLGIVRGHRGAMRVYSTPGRGTAFKVLFPASSAVPAPVSHPSLDYRGAGVVLVVDDDPSVRTIAGRMLTHLGFRVIEAENGRVGVDRFRERAHEIVLVLLDMTMPVMGGEEALDELRALRADVPVVRMSGYSEVEATRGFISRGITAFLQKPFMPSDLVAKLASILPSRES